MYKRLNTNVVSMHIPAFGNRYLIDSGGHVFDTVKNTLLELVDGMVTLVGDNCCISTDPRVLLYFCFSNSCLDFVHWSKFTAFIYSNDCSKPLVERIFIRPPVGGFSTDGVHYYIVGYSRYSITRDGKIYSKISKRYLSTHLAGTGYYSAGLQPDLGQRRVETVHRLLGLAFLEYPDTISKLDINHIDCDKTNNRLNNIEWVTRSGNNLHAVENGLNTQAMPIELRWPSTGAVKSYPSISMAARAVGVKATTMQVRVKSRGQTIYPEGFQVRAANEKLAWDLSLKHRAGVSRAVFIRCLVRDVIYNFSSASRAALFLDISPAHLLYRLGNSLVYTHGTYIISYNESIVQLSSQDNCCSLIAGKR